MDAIYIHIFSAKDKFSAGISENNAWYCIYSLEWELDITKTIKNAKESLYLIKTFRWGSAYLKISQTLASNSVSPLITYYNTSVLISSNCSRIRFLLKRHKENVTTFCSRVFNNRSVTLKL